MKLYKLTDKDGKTKNDTQWSEGVTHAASGEGELCTKGWIHAYEHPLLAILHDSIHGNFGDSALLWECETSDENPKREGQMKLGVRSLTTLKQISKPQISTEQRIRYAILCAKEVCTDPSWNRWADDWLSGKDRTWAGAAWAAAAAAARAARAWAAEAEAAAAARAARAAARANNSINLISLATQACDYKED